MTAATRSTDSPRRILVMTAHPDDADIMAGGTVARWLDEGNEVGYVVFTRGDKGHDDPAMTPDAVAALREAEQRAAAATLGVSRVTFLDFDDGELAWAGPALAEARLDSSETSARTPSSLTIPTLARRATGCRNSTPTIERSVVRSSTHAIAAPQVRCIIPRTKPRA